MYAVVKTGGKQYRVAPGDTVRVEKLPAEVGTEITLGEVLLVADGDELRLGTPVVPGAAVKATVVAQGRGEKAISFKLRRRKSSKRRTGHRQSYTEIRITGITA